MDGIAWVFEVEGLFILSASNRPIYPIRFLAFFLNAAAQSVSSLIACPAHTPVHLHNRLGDLHVQQRALPGRNARPVKVNLEQRQPTPTS